MLEIPTWGLIILICSIMMFTFLVFKMFGLNIRHSILCGFIISGIVLLIVHSFDVNKGTITSHPGDTFASIYLLTSLTYIFILILYEIFNKLAKKWCSCCCCPKYETRQEKIIRAYGPDDNILDKLMNNSETLPKLEDIEIITGTEERDRRNMSGAVY